MMKAADWDGELIADLAAERARLSEPQMVRLGWRTAADKVLFVAQPNRLGGETGSSGGLIVMRGSPWTWEYAILQSWPKSHRRQFPVLKLARS